MDEENEVRLDDTGIQDDNNQNENEELGTV